MRREDPFNIGMQGGFGGGIETNYGPGLGPEHRYKRADKSIEEEANMRLHAHAELQNAEVHVFVKDAVLFLSGTVPDDRIKYSLADEMEMLPGVEEVHNELHVEAS